MKNVVIGYCDYCGNYEDDDGDRVKGYIEYISSDYFEGWVCPPCKKTIRNRDHSIREAELHARTQEQLGELGINKA